MTKGVSLKEEVMADQGKPSQCRVCAWLEAQPASVQAEWDELLNLSNKVVTHSSLARAAARRDVPMTRGSIENHRAALHRAAKNG